jgi:ribosome-associated protein
MEGKELANFIARIIKDKKGDDVVIINVKKLTVLTEYFVVCSSLVEEHSRSIAEEIGKQLKDSGEKITNIDRGTSDSWIALDCGNVIVHIMTEEKRKFYNLERIWQEVEPELSRKKRSKENLD